MNDNDDATRCACTHPDSGDHPTFHSEAEAEAWVCAQTGHPGTTTPPDEPGDCEGEGL